MPSIPLALLKRLTVGSVFRESALSRVLCILSRGQCPPRRTFLSFSPLLILGPLKALDQADKFHLSFLGVAYLRFPVCTRSRISDLHKIMFCIYFK
ncbi:hypothetical protein BO86DRAFT_331350 [Aspergillus japonicus CBS 114.51]|uniref:Uncharacterized protein n=1 Tax=Aspergillus japonicus CBS 114.51 TaxID=1448312 RepID=A0A8T8XCA4_ASPJA|nr:hypothetical protein BO86DRAFT_331350 [Aspergillus japonicus CBS 114.51]RAH85886.1 hypothetical protein BO86DRAFT_331350 [Aspergillus japonicus CBS 114.51]